MFMTASINPCMFFTCTDDMIIIKLYFIFYVMVSYIYHCFIIIHAGLTNGYELKALIKWTIVVTICTQCSQEMRKLIIKEGVHIQLLVKLIDLPHASTAHQEVCMIYKYN